MDSKNIFAVQATEPNLYQKFKYWLRDCKYSIKSRFERFIFWTIKRMTTNSNLVRHAERELRLAGLFDKDSDYGGMLADAVIDLVRVFSLQGHSGFSAKLTLRYFGVVADFKTLTPISSNPEEWNNVSLYSNKSTWQNKRDSRYFSYDGGNTWHNVDDCLYIVKSTNGATFTTGNIDNLELGEEVVKAKQCDTCMIKCTCDKATLQLEATP